MSEGNPRKMLMVDNGGIAVTLIRLLPEIAAAVTGAAVVQWVGWGGVAFMILFVIIAELIYPLHTRRE